MARDPNDVPLPWREERPGDLSGIYVNGFYWIFVIDPGGDYLQWKWVEGINPGAVSIPTDNPWTQGRGIGWDYSRILGAEEWVEK